MLTCELDDSEPVAWVRVTGVLTIGSSVEVRDMLRKALAGEPAAVVIDLDGMVVGDDTALAVFTAFGRAAAEWPGCPVAVSAADEGVRHDLERLAVTQVVGVYPDRLAAVAAVARTPLARTIRRTLGATPAATGAARAVVRAACASAGLEHLSDDAELIVTELVGNVVRHVGGELVLMIGIRQRLLHLAVRDSSRTRPVRVLADPDSGEGGRGLLLVDAVASGWGVAESISGKVVWATLRIGH